MTRAPLMLFALTLATLAGASSSARAADPTGVWLSEDGDVKMKVAHCGAGICSTIAWLRDPNDNGRPKVDKNNPDTSKRNRPIIGSQIITGMKADGADKWSGNIYNAEDGKTYSGSFAVTSASAAELKGCVAIFCKTKAWSRSN